MTQNQAKTTIDEEEVARFSKIADEWWDPRGKFAPLHKINPLRIGYITDRIQDSGFRIRVEDAANLKSESRSLPPSVLDIGCGGGLIAEPLAKLGLNVTAIDASEKNIRVAQMHAESSGVKVDYRCTTAEDLVNSEWRMADDIKTQSPIANHQSPTYDVVLALEIVEHVADVPMFVEAVCKLVKPGGLLIMSTLNRTAKSYALAIVGAEYILRWLPVGTHTWQKFLKPHELVRQLEKHGCAVSDMQGMVMNPLNQQWRWDAKDLSVNYIITAKRQDS